MNTNPAIIINKLKIKPGRRALVKGILNLCYPVTRALMEIYRKTVLRKVKIITVIGSLGKSTTCRAVAELVGDQKLKGFSNYKNSVILNLLKHLPSEKFGVIEAGIDGPGIMAGYARMLNPDIVVVTSIASEHILSFESLEHTRNEKSLMIRDLSAEKVVVLNWDDPNVRWMAGRTQAKIITYGFRDGADIRAENIRINPPDGMSFDVWIDRKKFRLRISLLGRQMVYPVLAALAVAVAEKIDLHRACQILETLKPLEARMQTVQLPSGLILIRDELKATRETVWRALETLREYPAERKILVLGGISEILKHEHNDFFYNLGAKIATSSNLAFLQLNKKSFSKCKAGALDSGMAVEDLVRIKLDPVAILSRLPLGLGTGDVILVKGKNEYKISRLSLSLMGRPVKCRLESCSLVLSSCESCPRLEKGWGDRKTI